MSNPTQKGQPVPARLPFIHLDIWKSRATSASHRRRHKPAPEPEAAKAGPGLPKRLMDSSWSCTPLADGTFFQARQHGSQQLHARTVLRALLGLIYAHGAHYDKYVNAQCAHFFSRTGHPSQMRSARRASERDAGPRGSARHDRQAEARGARKASKNLHFRRVDAMGIPCASGLSAAHAQQHRPDALR